ncbi:hypothetical protein CLOM_g11007, partial [Closterium sp. NIES-68]
GGSELGEGSAAAAAVGKESPRDTAAHPQFALDPSQAPRRSRRSMKLPAPSSPSSADQAARAAAEVEAARQLKREEAARRRKQQSERAARAVQENAIQKILGQDGSRKRREQKIQKKRQEEAEERLAASQVPPPGFVRMRFTAGGVTVAWSPDSEQPAMFLAQPPLPKPPLRSLCAAAGVSQPLRYRDSQTHLPLCSLHCYKTIHATLPAAAAAPAAGT